VTYAKEILLALDKLGNAIAGGNHKCTVSARVGYFQYNAIWPSILYWKILAFIIDFTFFPLDDHHHCREAYRKEQDEEFRDYGNVAVMFLLSLIVMVSCMVLSIIFWTIHLTKLLVGYIKKSSKK
jgi:hypothetical protein